MSTTRQRKKREGAGTPGIVTVKQGVTGRKRSEEALQRHGEELQTILDSVPASIFYKDRENRFVRVNKAFAEMVGMPKEEIEGKSCFDLFPHQAETVWRDDKEVMASGLPKNNIVEPVETPDRKIWVQTDKIPYRDEKGTIIGVIGFSIDITERRRAEEALRQSEAFLNTIIENIPDMIFVKDVRKLQFVMFNKAVEELLGYTREDLIGKGDYDFFPDKEADFFTAKDRDVLHGKRLLDIPEEEIQTRHKGVRILHTKKIPILDNDGNPQFLLGISEDITERKRADDMRHTQALILDSLAEGVVLVDEKGVIVMTNPSMDAMFGYDRGELIGKPVGILTHLSEKESRLLLKEITARVSGEHIYTVEFRNRKKDGTPFITEARIANLQIGDGRFLIAIQRDVTEKRRLEQQVLEVSDREQARIGMDLHDGLCQQLVGLAFSADLARQDLAAGSRLKVARLDKIKTDLDHAITQARDLAHNLTAANLTGEGLRDALHELGGNIQRQFQVRCVVECAESIIACDQTVATHVYRIAREAAFNAVKHAAPAEIRISLAVDGKTIRLTVADNGKGIEDARKCGPGMGLSIMRYRSSMIGGELDISRAPSGGTIIACNFPGKQLLSHIGKKR